ncbi:Gfo/Idh/MocA family protein [Cyclobacterium jeungdonense]|uniref:Gfo/Idh/MocA family oxidoreductase n=1 Tax=Cyclobacterium jeungdonense TaxID=708087 RepID=A0ABT8C2P0_9BACT|nr:Gfo/Idh/MocA family oxidoreductase [Cyclobacterium jeungdonense]MDN3687049.1 Gfo/Idh/MocA family oxidoreductase [Cyclobacterium jeungdonense]
MISIGIIGAGNFSVKHIEAIRKLPSLRLKAICRRDPLALNHQKKTYGVEGYTDYKELLEDPTIDAVLIATPHHLHATIAITAAGAGKHILLEKPMASTWEDCLAINDACEKNNVKLMLGQVAQFSPAFVAAKKYLEAGELGVIHMARATSVSFWKHAERQDWHLTKNTGGGYLLSVAVHQLDLLCALIPSRVRGVYAMISNRFHRDEVDDGGIIILKFSDGQQASLHFSGFQNGVNQVDAELYGANGIIKISHSQGTYLGKNQKWELLPESYTENWMADALESEWKDFARAIELNRQPKVSGEHGLYVMEVLFAALTSSVSGKEVALPINFKSNSN